MRHHFAAYNGGNHQICINNQSDRNDEEFEFSMQTGIQAKDYSAIVTKKHLKPVELQATQLSDMVEQLRNELNALTVGEELL